MNFKKTKTVATTAIVLIFVLSTVIAILPANAQVGITQPRKTAAYLDVAPKLVGVGQTMTINLWVFPPPDYYSLSPILAGYSNITVTFTRPDGTKDTFMPTDGSSGGILKPGMTEQVGTLWFQYKPNQVGTWTVQFSMPQQSYTDRLGTVTYTAVTSTPTTFTVQKDLVLAGVLNGWPFMPLPTNYWTRPINSNNREWYQVAGDYLPPSFLSTYQPYSTAPNTGHIVWNRQVSTGGIIGGDWGSLSYGAGGGTPGIIMAGKIYYNDVQGGKFNCVNLRTGQLLWTASGTITLGWRLRATGYEGGLPTPDAGGVNSYLIGTGSTSWTVYDPMTGALLSTITGIPSVSSGKRVEAGMPDITVGGRFASYWFEGSPYVYCVQESGYNTTLPDQLAINNLIKWDYTKVTGNNWGTGIVWNITLKGADGSPGPGDSVVRGQFYQTHDYSTGVVIHMIGGENRMKGFNLTDGSLLWTTITPFVQQCCGQPSGTDIMYNYDPTDRIVYGYDMYTGKQLWKSPQIMTYPWGSQSAARGSAYGMIYWGGYDGIVQAIDAKTGKIVFTSDFIGNTTETVFNTYAFYAGGLIADGKVFLTTTEHTPTQPRVRWNMLIALDAFTGKFLWNITNAIVPRSIADGYLIGVSENDGMMYCFGKGQTAVTISAPQVTVPKGTTVLLQGTIMDQSPGSPSTPCVSKDSMSVWMNYLYNQAPKPTDVKGVPVALSAVKSDGTSIAIGTVTSDADGYFNIAWTPPDTGVYKIVASFAGDESYWSSSAKTGLSVGPASAAASASVQPTIAPTATPEVPGQTTSAPTSTSVQPTSTPSASPTVAPPPQSAAPSMTMYYAIAGIVAAIIVVAALALVLRRRK